MENTEHSTDPASETKAGSSNNGLIAVVIIMLLTIVAGGYFVIGKKEADKPEPKAQLSVQQQLNIALEAAQKAPTVSNLINLGLAYFNAGKYTEAIAINTQVLQIDSTNALACNNLCAAYNNIARYEEGEYFCKLALRLNENYELAKNNLAFAQKRMKTIAELQQKMGANAGKNDFIELGLYHYKRMEFGQAIAVYETALKKIGEDALIYNNLCAAHCEVKEWDKAVSYCEKSLQLQPDFSLAKNNLQWAKDGKAGKYD